MNTDDEQPSPECVRRIRTEWRELLNNVIEAEVVPVPARIFSNSLFVEITFGACEDAEALDQFARLMGWLHFYWEN